MAQGTLKRLLREKGFGFIQDNSTGQEYFVHRSEARGFDSLQEGDLVEFDPTEGPKGLRAANTRKL